ncbi:LysR substrate-binding domain-containing protein [Bremerella alba]|uniref:HTH-type transcriptional regulator GltC n=1 Tax=Bremerella alba TaxID=980252 RepID=A0A7V8VAB2_9BACT|nr:LysR substrate-binding domain-containing protein [Bremerella alba]MBA2117868.1 HTH-type transcriptional regulator GltC [Bremerella alba]
MELRHLRYFVAVATELSFSRAAESQFVAQPALSTQIADLEKEIGARLLFRNKRVVRLTPAGSLFLKEARAILKAADEAKSKALNASRGELGQLRVGFFAAPMMYLLPDLIRSFRLEYPKVTTHLHELTPDRQLVAFANDELDIGFTRPLPSGNLGLTEEVLFRERFFAVVPQTHRLATRKRVRLVDLANEPFVLLNREVACGLYDHIIHSCREHAFSPDVKLSPELMTAVLTLVAAEQGVSIIPEGVRNLRRRQVAYIPISPAIEPIPLVMCWRNDSISPTMPNFRKLVQQCLPRLRQAERT